MLTTANIHHIVHSDRPRGFTFKWPALKTAYWDQYRRYIHIFDRIIAADRPALVLEDDAVPKPLWLEELAGAPQDFDFLFLSDDFWDHPLKHISGCWYASRHSKTTCATLFSVKAAKALARQRLWCKEAMDWTINRLLERDLALKACWHLPGLFEHGSVTGRYMTSI